MPTIRTSVEAKRGCGFRKGGGLYLVCEGTGRACGKLPFAIEPCEHCAAMGVKCRLEQSRSWTSVDIDKLFSTVECKADGLTGAVHCSGCPLQGDMGKGGLLWVGERFYPTPRDFTDESDRMGISKRLPLKSIPKDLRDDDGNYRWVLLAHPKAIDKGPCPRCGHHLGHPGEVPDADKPGEWTECPECKGTARVFGPGIFRVFKPSGLEYVVKGDESDEELEALEKRGIDLVKVIPEGQNDELDLSNYNDPHFGDDEDE